MWPSLPTDISRGGTGFNMDASSRGVQADAEKSCGRELHGRTINHGKYMRETIGDTPPEWSWRPFQNILYKTSLQKGNDCSNMAGQLIKEWASTIPQIGFLQERIEKSHQTTTEWRTCSSMQLKLKNRTLDMTHFQTPKEIIVCGVGIQTPCFPGRHLWENQGSEIASHTRSHGFTKKNRFKYFNEENCTYERSISARVFSTPLNNVSEKKGKDKIKLTVAHCWLLVRYDTIYPNSGAQYSPAKQISYRQPWLHM